MRLLSFYALALSALTIGASTIPPETDASQLYDHAMAQLGQLPHKFHNMVPIYTHKNLHKGIHVPQYDDATQDYRPGPQPRHDTPQNLLESRESRESSQLSDALETLKHAAELGSSAAAVALADVYMFGNFSVPTNYSRALSYYHLAVAQKANGHAYFMLGFIYSTGMFGELPADKQRAKIYYEFAARNGDTNALLVLANDFLKGVECSANCEMAQFYYSRLARQVIKHYHESGLSPQDDLLSHNINLADFKGGIYGKKISESQLSVLRQIDNFISLKDPFKERNIGSSDSPIIDDYFSALEHLHGGYFAPRNATRAYLEALRCVYHGRNEIIEGRLRDPKSLDRVFWNRCQGLLGRMYLNGEGTERDLARAYYWLDQSIDTSPDMENLLHMALLRKLDPTSNGQISSSCKYFLQEAARNGSAQALFLFAKSSIAPVSPLETNYEESTYDLVRKSSVSGNYEATFYFADAVESGISVSKGHIFSCEELVSLYKNFVERSESVLLPHIYYAYEELSYGNYKNALLGYSIAAEQGILNAQLSAAFLLYQKDPLFAMQKRSFNPDRLQAALRYLDLASAQGHIDSTILLGDLYSTGFPGGVLETDYDKAFAYYSTAASSASAHACFKLGYMYEYGLGCANNTPDFYMAKRYYDLSIKYYQDVNAIQVTRNTKPNTYTIGFALLRLRLRFLFSNSQKRDDSETVSWLGTLKNLAKSKDSEALEDNGDNNAEAHAEGQNYEVQEDYQLFDYIVLGFTLTFFLYVGYQNLRGQLRRVGQRQNVADADHANGPNRPRFRMEFFFAI
ncbi:hypothetical protein JCM33374_g2704 [Metschnikowia sp. JCM 33374]|nr:hypothetical protein JCM33374_g2704 [Metschnikowia sp. JCM 33374]